MKRTDEQIEAFFWRRVVKDPITGCLIWIGATTGRHQYGKYRGEAAHRWIWKRRKGPIPRKRYLDHLCRNVRCVNLAHLEVVTNRENINRGPNSNARKTHCSRGHELVAPNIKLRNGRRVCLACQKINNRRFYPRGEQKC